MYVKKRFSSQNPSPLRFLDSLLVCTPSRVMCPTSTLTSVREKCSPNILQFSQVVGLSPIDSSILLHSEKTLYDPLQPSIKHPVFETLLHLGEALQLPAQQLHLLLASDRRFGHGGPL